MSWYDDLGELTIKMLKENATPFGLCPEWKQEVFYAMHAEDIGVLQVYKSSSGWIPYDRAFGFPMKSSTYRLNPNWKRPEEKPEKKEGHWEYCEVYIDAGTYRFALSNGVDHYLFFAFNLSGFGGIEFAERPGEWHTKLMLWNDGGDYLSSAVRADKDTRPATPKRVRFWVEG